MVIYPTAGSAATANIRRVRVSNATNSYVRVGSTWEIPTASGCSWDLIYDSSEATSALTPVYLNPTSPLASAGTSATLYCKIWNEGTDWNNEWYRVENGVEAFGEPCQTAVSEWAWVDEGSTHPCTANSKVAFVKNGYLYQKPLSPEEQKAYNEKRLRDRFQRIIKERCAPNIIVRNSKRQPLPMPADIREQRARDTLRRVIGDNKFGNFIKHGFISIKARSGLVYQIFPGHGFTNVYNQGQMVECLCVILRGDFPPTDSLIMRYLLILNNEQQFRSYANKQSVHQPIRSHLTGEVDTKSLTEIFRDLKKKIA